jgi:transaldolase
MKPKNLKTKIFLDGGDPQETEKLLGLLGFLDGQTTNPTLVAKNPEVEKRLKNGEKFTMDELLSFYKTLVEKLSRLIPDGSISIEVFADKNTTASEMFTMGKEMYSWIPNAHIKYPTNKAGIEAAIQTVHIGARVNMTLCFSQEQAAAVYAATKMDTYKTSLPGYKNVFLSPFIGRLDDRDENGMSFINNVLEMYRTGDQHVEVLSASVRTMDHFMAAIALRSDIITAPFSVLKTWAENGMQIPDKNFAYQTNLKNIPYKKLDLNKDWKTFNIQHDLTDIGIDKFANDANTLLE